MGSLSALNELDDKRIKCIKPLIPPQILMEDIPLTLKAAQTILEGRKAAENVIKGLDDRLLVVVGPCSIHDVKAAKEYGEFRSRMMKRWKGNTAITLMTILPSASRLIEYARGAKDDLLIIMRVYFEKPRTTVGWKGLINDPQLNNRLVLSLLSRVFLYDMQNSYSLASVATKSTKVSALLDSSCWIWYIFVDHRQSRSPSSNVYCECYCRTRWVFPLDASS